MKEVEFYRNLPRLETERLVLRKYSIGDVDDYFDFASDKEVTKFLRWGPHPDKEFTMKYIQSVIDGYLKGKDSPWGLEHKKEKKLIGIIHLMQLDTYHRKAQIGFVLARDYWNNGYMAETLNKVLEYCFTILSLNRIEALCISDNYAAAKVLSKIGMHKEGLMKKYLYQKENFRDFIMFSVLKEDYISKDKYV
jgi:ribosomal-protein-alanine N-acetyltransferase